MDSSIVARYQVLLQSSSHETGWPANLKAKLNAVL